MANDLFDIDWDLLDEQDLIVITNTVGLERTPRLSAREAAALLADFRAFLRDGGWLDAARAVNLPD